jgi:hypothetical protein
MMGVSPDTEIEMDDARTIAEWAVTSKRVPPPHLWIQGLIDQQTNDPLAGFI